LFTGDSCRLASVLTGTPQFQTDVFDAPEVYLSNQYFGLGVGFGDTLIVDSVIANDWLRSYNNGVDDISVLWMSFASPEQFPSTGIGENSFNKVTVYPNPTSNYLSVDTDELKIENIPYQIFNSVGQLSQSGIFEENLIDISKLISGYYTISLIMDNQLYHSTLVVLR
jgi:hypothetical protein